MVKGVCLASAFYIAGGVAAFLTRHSVPIVVHLAFLSIFILRFGLWWKISGVIFSVSRILGQVLFTAVSRIVARWVIFLIASILIIIPLMIPILI